METMQPALKNGRNVWDRVNMPESEFESPRGTSQGTNEEERP